MAALADEELGGTIGFSTSEIKAVRSNSQISVITPGIFLRHLMSGDLRASEVGAIIVDELHEGSIDYHLALGLMKLMQQGGELPPTVLTSATMNREGVQGFFDIPDDQYVKIEGRAYPVNVRYAEQAYEARQGKYEYIRLAAEEVKKACATKGGDILVFMPGAREINDCIKQVGTILGVEVIPLHGGLTPKDRDYALSGDKPSGVRRRVIVATNIAETSVTVPGVTLVIDTCRERSVRYNSQTGI
jgi:ATP-dependent helicase HrpB